MDAQAIPPERGCVSVVVITQNRRDSVLHTLGRLSDLAESPPVIVIDNASSDGTADAVRQAYPQVDVIRLEANLGAAARTVGVRQARTPYVAFSDDDSWWETGALQAACGVLDRVPRLGLLAGRILVGPDAQVDPVCLEMQRGALGDVPSVGPRVLGFVACGAVVRRSAYLDVGGFHPRYGVGGEESLLAIDLTERGWECAYVDHVVARHDPSSQRDARARQAREVRNDLWTVWLRRRPAAVVSETLRLLRRCAHEPGVRGGAWHAARGWRWVARERESVSQATERQLRLLSDPV